MTHKQALLQRCVEYLDSQKWRYDFFGDEGNTIRFNMNIKSKLSTVNVIIDPKDREILIFAVCPLKATPDVYPNVVEFITRANFGLKLGNFEFDYSDGEIRYKSCIAATTEVPALDDVERCIDITFLMFQRYGDGLVKNLMGFGDPAADVKACEA